MSDWEQTIAFDRERYGDERVDKALANSLEMAARQGIGDEEKAALRRHGYAPDVPCRGVGGDTSIFITNDARFDGGYYLRNRICELDGILIDGHESAEGDSGDGCADCGKPWSEICADEDAEENA
ncbi:hypothetical protein [Nocardia aurea]|uniref:hypothetical protein n=1 Tax=Nocardia aurea TaxID=2144174 RepID=UPI0033BCBC5B